MSTEKNIKGEIWDWLHSTETLTHFQKRMIETYGEDYREFLRKIGPINPEHKTLLSRMVHDLITSVMEVG